jgi:putative flippase GtrA
MIKELYNFQWLSKNKREIGYWILSGLALAVITNLFLYVFVEYIGINLALGTILSGQLGLLSRFLINQKLIFKKKDFFVRSFIKFQISSSFTFLVWLSLTNILAEMSVHYIISSILALCISTIMNFVMNFFWIWNKETKL